MYHDKGVYTRFAPGKIAYRLNHDTFRIEFWNVREDYWEDAFDNEEIAKEGNVEMNLIKFGIPYEYTWAEPRKD